MAKNDQRPTWDQYFMSIAKLASTRSTCLRRKVGAVIVKNKRILSTGYNGAPRNLQHCLEIGCLREKLNIKSGERHELCRAIHAEQNAVIQAAVSGVSIENADIYCTTFPCVLCSKIIINAGIRKITVIEGYPDELSQQMLDEAGIEVRYLREEGLIAIPEDNFKELL
jgi:dCMP deaminase